MARRRRSYRKSYSYGSRSRRRRSSSSYGRRSGGRAQTIRLQFQQPAAPRPPFGSFSPSAFGPFGMMGPGAAFGQQFAAPGAPHPAMGGPGVPGARMVINPIPRSPEGISVPPGYRLVREDAHNEGLEDPT